jgi:Tfp pilus assembly protein PilF
MYKYSTGLLAVISLLTLNGPAQALDSITYPLVQKGYQEMTHGSALSSIDTFSQAVRTAPNDPVPRRYMAYALLKAGLNESAIEQFQQLSLMELIPPQDQVTFGIALLDAGLTKQAADQFSNCLDTNPKIIPARMGLIIAYQNLGEKSKAEEQCVHGMKNAKTKGEWLAFYHTYSSIKQNMSQTSGEASGNTRIESPSTRPDTYKRSESGG